MSQYLDKDGVAYLWSKIKALELPNPNAISIYYNSTKAFDYDGSAELSLSIKQGDNITVTGNENGEITIAGTPDTKNTAGSTQDTAKLFIVGAKTQGANPQTFSNNKVYIDSDKLYSNGVEVTTLGHTHAISDITGLQNALDELESDISTIPKFAIEVVSELPTTDISKTTIYLVPTSETSTDAANLYTEYIRITRNSTDVWEKLGEQKLDISNKINGVSSVTQNDIVTWGANGTTVKDSGISIDTTVNNNDTTIPTGKAIQSYVSDSISNNAVTNVSTGIGLTGGPITTTGTIKANLKSETAMTNDSTDVTNTADRTYAVATDKSGYLAVNVPWTDTKVTQNVSTTNKNYPILLSYYESTSSTTTAQVTSRDNSIYINPSTHTLTATNIVADSITENGTSLDDKYKPISYVPTWNEITGKVTATTDTLGIVKTSSTVTSATGLTASPIIDGVVYYKDTTYSQGTGISISGTTINHSNSVTAVTTAGFLKLKYDAQGHITGTTAVTKKDITDLGVPTSDTHYTTHLYVTTSNGTSATTTPLANGAVNLRLFDDTTARETYSITGSGVTSVTTDNKGNIIIDTPMTAITNAELDAICV